MGMQFVTDHRNVDKGQSVPTPPAKVFHNLDTPRQFPFVPVLLKPELQIRVSCDFLFAKVNVDLPNQSSLGVMSQGHRVHRECQAVWQYQGGGVT
jgi:hypothetical protein